MFIFIQLAATSCGMRSTLAAKARGAIEHAAENELLKSLIWNSQSFQVKQCSQTYVGPTKIIFKSKQIKIKLIRIHLLMLIWLQQSDSTREVISRSFAGMHELCLSDRSKWPTRIWNARLCLIREVNDSASRSVRWKGYFGSHLGPAKRELFERTCLGIIL